MTLPDPLTARTPPRPSQTPADRPRIIDQAHQADGTVLVTWAHPGLHRVTVRMPWRAWVDGLHLREGAADYSAILPEARRYRS